MIIRLLKNMIKQSGQSIVRGRNMSMASIGSVTATLIILGIVLILVLNMSNVTNTTKKDFDQVQAYLDLELTADQVKDIGEKLKKVEGVKTVKFVSKEQALENMKDRLEENKSMLDGLEKNPFQNIYTVYLKDVEQTDTVAQAVRAIEGVDEVIYYKDVLDKLIQIANVTRVGGIAIISVLLVISIFIISNTIKITVMARETEIGIMKYVGATNGFIRGPFIIEGVFLGLAGAFISIIIVSSAYKYILKVFETSLNEMLSMYIIPAQAIMTDIIIIFVSLGVGIGIIGSIISLRRFLKV